jgi:hypothetical protein
MNVVLYVFVLLGPPALSTQELQRGVPAAVASIVVYLSQQVKAVRKWHKGQFFQQPRPTKVNQGLGYGVVLKQLQVG